MKALSTFVGIVLCLSTIAQQPGTLDLTYDARPHRSFVNAQNAVVQSDLKVIVSGNVGKDFGTGSTVGIARMNTDGSIDSTFKCSFPLLVDKLLLDNQEHLLVLSRKSLYKFLPDGRVDDQFIFDSEYPVKDAALLADNNIIVLESRPSGDVIYRVKSYGLPDPGFVAVEKGTISAMGILVDGIALSFLDTTDKKYDLIKVDYTGVQDTSFGSVNYVDLNKIVGLPNGGLYVRQKQQTYWGFSLQKLDAKGKYESEISMDARDFCIDKNQFVYVNNGGLFFKVDTTGEISKDFVPSACTVESRLTTDELGRIYVTGDLYRVKPEGGLDSSFVVKQLPTSNFGGIDNQDRLYVQDFNGDTSRIHRYKKDGTLDVSFPEIKSSGIYLVELDGTIIVYSGISNDVHRYSPAGVRDPMFHTTYGVFHRLKSGKYIAQMYSWDYTTIIRLHSDGKLDTSFKSVDFKDYYLKFIHELPDGKLIAGMAGFPQGNLICRLNANGGRDNTYQSKYPSMLKGDFQKDNKFVFYTSENQPLRIRRLMPDGTYDVNFTETPVTSDYFNSELLVDKNDNIIVSTNYQMFRLKPNGELDKTFANGVTPQTHVKLMLQSDNQILCLGRWSFYSETPGEGRFRLFNGPDYTGIDEEAERKQEVLAYPNPASEILYIDKIINGPVQIEIYSINGQLVRKSEANKSEEALKVEVKDLHSGSYVLRIIGQAEVQSLHFSKF